MVHLPFEDRVEAGRLLAKELSSRRIDSLRNNSVVLALTRGGVQVGFEVADRLHIPLDIVVVDKLGVPWQPELAMGAIAGGSSILDEMMIRQLGISADDLEDTIAREQAVMRRREEFYRGGNPELDLHGRSAILVDDGLATGSTMLAALRHVRRLDPAKVIIGVPVGSKEACDRLRKEVDVLVCLAMPDLFFAVGEWYRDFEEVSDAEVRTCWRSAVNNSENIRYRQLPPERKSGWTTPAVLPHERFGFSGFRKNSSAVAADGRGFARLPSVGPF